MNQQVINNIFKLDKDTNNVLFRPYYSDILPIPTHDFGFIHYNHTNKLKQFKYKEFDGSNDKPYMIFNNVLVDLDTEDNEANITKDLNSRCKLNRTYDVTFLSLYEILNMYDIKKHVIDEDYDDVINVYCKSGNMEKVKENKSKYSMCFVIPKLITVKELEKKDKFGSQDYHFVTMEGANFNTILKTFVKKMEGLDKDGVCILRVYELYTHAMAQFVSLLTQMFTSVSIVLPECSNSFSSERYIVCDGFNKDPDHMNILKSIDNKKTLHFIDNGHIYGEKFKTSLINANRTIEGKIYKYINIIDIYLNERIFKGKVYEKRRLEIEQYNKRWMSKYIPGMTMAENCKKHNCKFWV